MKMEQCSETSAYKIQTPGNYPEESIQYTKLVPHTTHYKDEGVYYVSRHNRSLW